MKRAVKSLQPFDFRSDFAFEPAPPALPQPDEDKVNLSGHDLAMLLTEARAEAYAMAMSQRNEAQSARLQRVTENLTDALANLVSLASHLEASAYAEGFKLSALDLVTATAQRIVDGQGDLFAQSAELSQKTRPTVEDGS
jgi:hypothetical protein